MAFLPEIPAGLSETSGAALQWPELIGYLARRTQSSLGKEWMSALGPSSDSAWIARQQQRNAEMRRFIAAGPFDLRGIFDVAEALEKARIEGAALEAVELREVIAHAERVEAWRQMMFPRHETEGEPRSAPQSVLSPVLSPAPWPALAELAAPLEPHDLSGTLRSLSGKIEPDGSLNDHASPELARIRRAMAQQHRAIESSLRRALAKLSGEGHTQDAPITVRGERFVIPVKAEFKRKVGGVVHGSSSSGQTVFVEPLETIEHNNELTRLLDEEQAEIHRILVAMTRTVAASAEALLLGAAILAEVDAHQAIAQFAAEFACVQPSFADGPARTASSTSREAACAGPNFADNDGRCDFNLVGARHPLLEMRLRSEPGNSSGNGSGDGSGNQGHAIVPLTIALPWGKRQLMISGPNTGGKTVALKTAGLLALMAQAGLPVPAASAHLPLFTGVYADIGDAQSIEQNLSTFSAHIVHLERIAHEADTRSLVLLDELGSATDPEEGAALAVAVAEYFLRREAWCLITTHLTSLKVYAATHEGVLNAAVGFDEAALAPTYELRLGVPGASAGLNIAARLGLDPEIVAQARARMTTQQVDIGRFLDELHAQLTAATAEREQLAARERDLARQRLWLEQEGRTEQQARTRELERQLKSLIEDLESQLRETAKAIDDKTAAQKIARDSALRVARLRREFSERFQTAIEEHNAAGGGESATAPAQRRREPHREARPGDIVRLKSLNREGRVVRVIDARTLEVALGSMKTRVPASDVDEILSLAQKPLDAVKHRGGITVSTVEDSGYMSSEINVIGRTADEAESEVERFLERAFLAGLPRIRVVHGVGMGILRRTLREFLHKHPHVTSVSEPPYNEGGQGATIVELRQ